MDVPADPAVPDVTAAPTSSEFRRHWRALLAATVGFAVGISIVPFYTNGLVVNALSGEFGWSRTQLSSLQLVGSAVLIVTAPVVGLVVDRARGLALGVSPLAAGAVAFLIPQVLGPLLAQDWRAGYRVLGVSVLVGAAVVLALMPPGRAVPDGEPERARAARTSIAPLLRRGLFVRLASVYLLLSAAVGWVSLYLVSLLRDAGASPVSAARTASLIGLALIVGRLVVGRLVDRFQAPRVGAGVLLVAAAGFLALLLGGAVLGAAAAIALGLALGAEVDLIGNLTSRYYDTAAYGRMFGAFYAIFMLGVGVSPLVVARLRDATGGYDLPLVLSVVLLVLASALLASAPRRVVAVPAS